MGLREGEGEGEGEGERVGEGEGEGTISCSGGGEPSYSPDGRHCTPPGSTAAGPPCPARAATASGCVAGAKTPTTRWKGRLSQFHEVNWCEGEGGGEREGEGEGEREGEHGGAGEGSGYQ